MSQRRLVDTNVIVRYLVQDHPRHAKVANQLFEACDRQELVLVILPAVLAECVFLLQSFYQCSRRDIAEVLSQLIKTRGVEISELPVNLDALSRYSQSNLHFVDCLIAAHAASNQLPVATFDTDFKKMKDVIVEIH
ncbi:MAG: PIN domain-containing protein [Planctomycetia bacterium]|nr:PIN domain-containing protein [Planctomycetia bacterium]